MADVVLVISRDRFTRDGLGDFLRQEERDTRVTGARSIAEAVQALASQPPQVILLDAGPGLSGDLRHARHAWPQAHLLVIARDDDRLALRQSLEAGARGFAVYGGDDPTRFLETFRQVRRGEYATCATALEQLIAAYLRNHTNPHTLILSHREREVMGLLMTGATDGQISCSLYMSVSTVRRHLDTIRDKLGARTRAHAVARFLGVPEPTTEGGEDCVREYSPNTTQMGSPRRPGEAEPQSRNASAPSRRVNSPMGGA